MYINKHTSNLIQIIEYVIINKEIEYEISEKNPDYCHIVKESFFLVYESLLHCIIIQFSKYRILKPNRNILNNINNNIIDSGLFDIDEDDDNEEGN